VINVWVPTSVRTQNNITKGTVSCSIKDTCSSCLDLLRICCNSRLQAYLFLAENRNESFSCVRKIGESDY
jgi:hypothetical protein